MFLRRIARVGLCGGLMVIAGCDTETLRVEAPVARTSRIAVDPLPPMSPSVVDAPMSYAVAPALSALEQAVPKHFGDIRHRIADPTNTRRQVAFEATRTPFHLGFDGRVLTVVSTVSYQGRGWYKPPLSPSVSASCGTSGPQPRVRIVISIAVDLTREWVVKTHSRVASIRPESATQRDACMVTMFKIDVTDRVMRAVRSQLENQLPTVDRQVAAFDVRTRMDRWYNLLNKSIHLHDSLWLVLAPQQLRLGGLRLTESTFVADVRLYALPSLVFGPRPTRVYTALPPLERAIRTVGDSAKFRVEALLSYGMASDMLSRALVGRTVRRYGRVITLSRIRAYALGDGRLALEVGVTGNIAGNAYLVGTPHLDTLSRTITVPDLDFDVATADALVRGLAWLRKADLVSQLRERARLPLEPLLTATREQAEEALNRTLAPGVTLSGRIRAGRLVDLAAQPGALRIRAEALGTLSLKLDSKIENGLTKRPVGGGAHR